MRGWWYGWSLLEAILKVVLSQVLFYLRVKNSSSRITLIVMVFVRYTCHDSGIDLCWVIIELEMGIPVLVHNHLMKSRCALSFFDGFSLKHLFGLTQKVLVMWSKINADNFMLCFFCSFFLSLILNCNGRIIRRLSVLHWSIPLVSNSEISTLHLLLNLFLVLNGGIFCKVLVFNWACCFLKPTLTSVLTAKFEVTRSQIHYWPLNLLFLKQHVVSLVRRDTLKADLSHFCHWCVLVATLGIRNFKIALSIVCTSHHWLRHQWLYFIST